MSVWLCHCFNETLIPQNSDKFWTSFHIWRNNKSLTKKRQKCVVSQGVVFPSQTVSVRTKNSTPVAAFKANLWNMANMKGAPQKHRLFCGDIELDDDLLPLHFYGVNDGSILQLGTTAFFCVTYFFPSLFSAKDGEPLIPCNQVKRNRFSWSSRWSSVKENDTRNVCCAQNYWNGILFFSWRVCDQSHCDQLPESVRLRAHACIGDDTRVETQTVCQYEKHAPGHHAAVSSHGPRWLMKAWEQEWVLRVGDTKGNFPRNPPQLKMGMASSVGESWVWVDTAKQFVGENERLENWMEDIVVMIGDLVTYLSRRIRRASGWRHDWRLQNQAPGHRTYHHLQTVGLSHQDQGNVCQSHRSWMRGTLSLSISARSARKTCELQRNIAAKKAANSGRGSVRVWFVSAGSGDRPELDHPRYRTHQEQPGHHPQSQAAHSGAFVFESLSQNPRLNFSLCVTFSSSNIVSVRGEDSSCQCSTDWRNRGNPSVLCNSSRQDQLELPVNSQRLFASTLLCCEFVETDNAKRLGAYCRDSFRFYLKDHDS